MRSIMSMIPQSEEDEEQVLDSGPSIACFSKEIKNCRFYCQLLGSYLKCQLFDLSGEQYYSIEYFDHSLPQSFTRYFSNINGLYEFITVKTKIFKNPSPGVIMCCQYMGKLEKYIRIEMVKDAPHQALKDSPYFCLLRKIARELFEEVTCLRMRLRTRDRQLANSQNKLKQMQKSGSTEKVEKGLKLTRQRTKQQGFSSQIKFADQLPYRRRNIKKKDQATRQEIKAEQPSSVKDSVIDNPRKMENQQEAKESEKMKQETPNEEKLLFEVAENAPFYSKFKIQQHRIEKINNSEPFEFHSKFPIRSHSKSYFTVFINKTKYKSISVGVFALTYYAQPTKHDKRKFSVCYDGYYGIILNESKQQRQNLTKFREGDIVKTAVDLDQKQVQWSINSKPICKVDISSNLLIYQLYPYCEVEDKGDILILNWEGNQST